MEIIAGGREQKMENGNFWDWDNGEGRRVSSVYQDAQAKEIKTEDVKEPCTQEQQMTEQNTEPQNVKPQVTQIPKDDSNQIQTDFILVSAPQTEFSGAQQEPVQTSYSQNNCEKTDVHSIIPVDKTELKKACLAHTILLSILEQQQKANQSRAENYRSKFTADDISENKVSAIAAYLLGPIGIIIALLIARDSAYTAFHVRQALKLTVSSVMLEIAAAILAVFGMIPFLGIIFKLLLVIVGILWFIVLVLKLIAIAQVCDGEAREPAVIGKLNCFC